MSKLSWGLDPEGLVASGANSPKLSIPTYPARAVFNKRNYDRATPVHTTETGEIYGHVCGWGSVHIGFMNKTVPVPKSPSNYAKICNKEVLTSDGSYVNTGPLVVDTVHPKTRRVSASGAKAFYDKTGNAVADVSIYEDEFGIQIAGSLRPGTTDEVARELRGSDISPDWRRFDGELDMVALMACNLSGFIVDGLVASGAEGEDEKSEILEALVASGAIEGDERLSDSDFVLPGKGFVDFSVSSGEVNAIFGASMFNNKQDKFAEMEQRLAVLEQAELSRFLDSLDAADA